MANITDKTNLNGHVDITDGKQNWISQINAGGTVYDIATHHSVTFVEGNNGAKTVWNGLTDLEVVIPSITDIVQTPIEFAGTVDANGDITWVNGHSKEEVGSLVFVTDDCTFAGKACEAGDMAIYDGTKWNIVSGENQVEIVGGTSDVNDDNRTTVAVGSAKDVLVVEGKALALTLDYAAIDEKVKMHVNGGSVVDVAMGAASAAVGGVDIKLEKTSSAINVKKTDFENATALADGTVTFEGVDSLITGVTFGEFKAGSFPTLNKNTEKNLVVSGGSVVAGSGDEYIKTVTLPAIKIVTADKSDKDITVLTGISGAKEGQEFLNNIHLTGEGENADLTIAGGYVPEGGVGATFVKGLKNDVTSVVTNYTSASLTAPSKVVTGFDGNSTVVTNVSASVSETASVLNTATVTDHVLSFGNTTVAKNVTVTPETSNLKLTTGDITWKDGSVDYTELVKGTFSQAADVKFTFGKEKETVYTPTSAMYKINTPELTVTKGAYTFDGNNMTACVPADTFGTGLTEGVLPSLSQGSVDKKATLKGSVGTTLTTSSMSINGLADGVSDFELATYALKTADSGKGDITVGAAGAAEVTIETSTVDLTDYVTSVDVTIGDAPQA